MREGKGFVTAECPLDIKKLSLWDIIDSEDKIISLDNSTVLLECVSNLVGNEMHAKGHETWGNTEVACHVLEEIQWLKDKVQNLVAVTNEFEPMDEYDVDTADYIEITGLVNMKLMTMADRVERVC